MSPRALILCIALLLLAAAPAGAHDAEVTHRDSIRDLNFDFVAAIENGETSIASGYGDAGLSYLPLRWCGTTRGTDDTANAAYDPSLPQVKIVYAYAADQPDRSAAWADQLQANASLISRFYAQQSGGLRAPRFDMGTSCGADYLDIATVALPKNRADYVGSFNALDAEVNALLPRTSAQPRNYVILADQLSPHSVGALWGQGSYYNSDTKGTGNINNAGGVSSVIWVPQGQSPATIDAWKDQGFWPEGFLHEMTHNFGGVQRTSPNTTGAGHCRDGRDVMCYADGGLTYDATVCSPVSTFSIEFDQMLDCGRDDYFSPSPTPSSWLDTHFNTFDNLFNGDCATLGNQCGGGIAPAVSGGPTITGAMRQGQTLTGSLGTWSRHVTLAHEWEEEVSGTWQAYVNPALTLTLTSANVGRRYRLKVTAVGTSETVVVRSPPTSAIGGLLTPRNDSKPVVSGTPRYGQTLSATPGTWTNGVSYTYQWLRFEDGGNWIISGATSPTYVPGKDDLGLPVRVKVTATSEDGVTTSAWSDLTSTVVSAPINDSAPVLSGTAKVGRTLSVTYGSWTSPWTPSYARQWQREVAGEWTPIDGATGGTYSLTAADAGLRVRAVVTVTNEHGSTAVPSGASTAVAAQVLPVNTAAPVASGNAQQGQTLTATGDGWAGTNSYSVRWERRAAGGDWATISGATTRTYVLTATDVDAEVRVVVTATNADGSTAAASPARGPVVTNVAPGNSALPQIGGVAQVGLPLTATTGTWLRALSYTYAWQRLASGTWTTIAGATGATYTPVLADAGNALRVVVTATGWGGSTAATSAQTLTVTNPPLMTLAPAITGTAKIGRTLSASPGTWLNATSHQYAWERQSGGEWSAIAGATAKDYVAVAADVGHALRVKVRGVNATDVSEPVASAATAEVAALQPPVNVTPPAVGGDLYEGETLTAQDDGWTGEATVAVRWQRRASGGEWLPIAGATARSYTLAAADLGADVRVLVTATNEDGDTTTSSASRGPVDGDPANVTAPSVAGVAQTGRTLTANRGTWLRAAAYAYAWQRQSAAGWVDVPGASDTTYAPIAADVGMPLRVVVTATGSRAARSVASPTTAAVTAPQPPANVAAPVVAGALFVGETLTVTSDDWTGEESTAVVWQRRAGTGSWLPIAGAAGRTYTLTSDDLGADVRAVVTAANAVGSTSEPSAARGPVDADPVNTAVPAITGTPKVGRVLSAGQGSWLRATTYSYAWQRLAGSAWAAIAGATSSTYTPVAADAGLPLRVVVTAAGSRASVAAPSAQTAAVAPLEPPVNVVAPAVTGTPRAGETLTAGADTWQKAETLRVHWQRKTGTGTWADLPGATARTYAVQSEDVGASLRALVTAANGDGETVAASPAVGPVAALPTLTTSVTPVPSATPTPADAPREPAPAPAASPAPAAPAAPAPPAAAGTDRVEVVLRSGRKAAGRLVLTVKGTTAAVTGTRLKLPNGTYAARFCAGSKCVSRSVRIAKGNLRIAALALPSAPGPIAVTLKPRRGRPATGRFSLPRGG